MNLADRIKARRELLGLSEPEVCSRAGLAKTYIRDLRTGRKKNLKMDTAYKIAEVLEVDVQWLFTGEQHTTQFSSEASELHQNTTELMFGHEDVVPVPIYDIRASAGAGALVNNEDVETFQPFRLNQLASLSNSRPSDLAVITVSGDSMWTTLHNGDYVLVDRTINRVVKDGIYILELDAELLVKRCQRNLTDGTIRVKSDNPEYDAFDVGEDRMLRVLGRVIWIGRALG